MHHPSPRPGSFRAAAFLALTALAAPLSGCGDGAAESAAKAEDSGKTKAAIEAAAKKGDDGPVKIRRVRNGKGPSNL